MRRWRNGCRRDPQYIRGRLVGVDHAGHLGFDAPDGWTELFTLELRIAFQIQRSQSRSKDSTIRHDD